MLYWTNEETLCMKNIIQSFRKLKELPQNVWAVGITSFFMDVSSEMIINIIPLFLANVAGVSTGVIGFIEGIGDTTASLLKLISGWLSDKLRARKWLAVFGYALSAFSKPFFLFANSWGIIAGVKWADRVGKGIRTSPRDALVADSVTKETRGIAFGLQKTLDSAGAVLGFLIAALVVWVAQKNSLLLSKNTFQIIVLFSIIPAILSVISLAVGAKDVGTKKDALLPKITFKDLGKPFMMYLVIVSLFTLGNSSDAFLVLRAQNLGISIVGIFLMLAMFKLIYSLVSVPAGSLSDSIGRRKVIIGGWLVYAIIYLGFAFANSAWQVWLLYVVYGLYYGLAFGTASAFVADLVPSHMRGTAYGTYNAIIGLLALPASLIAGILWQGAGSWHGFGPSAPFLFGGTLALIAVLLMAFIMPETREKNADIK